MFLVDKKIIGLMKLKIEHNNDIRKVHIIKMQTKNDCNLIADNLYDEENVSQYLRGPI